MEFRRFMTRRCEGGVRDGSNHAYLIWVLTLITLTGITSSANAAVYYLNTVSGSDTNPGSVSSPWKTLAKVQSGALAGDTVVLQQADAATCAAAWPEHVSYRTKTLQQWGITWTFDKEYTVGQFVNQDFWVVGPLTIVTIEPRSTLTNGRITNGSMVNPDPRKRVEGYDNGITVIPYDGALNVAFDLTAAKPLVLQPSSSLISTITYPDAIHRPQVKRAAILTVLNAAPPAGSFRPPYCGTDKTIKFDRSMLNRALLKNLPHVSAMPSIELVTGFFAAPWVEHIPGWTGEQIHPDLNMPHYGREIHTQIGVGALMLHMDFPPERKEKLLRGYVQVGIDYYGIIAAGGIYTWWNDGGHAGGRKWPILFAGLMLNDPAMKAIGQKSGDYLYADGHGPGNPPEDYIHFGEDDQTFYVAQLDVDVTNGPTWKPDARAVEKIPYTVADIGLPEWGIKHATHPETSNKPLSTNYRVVAGPPFHGTCLAALLMDGAKELWNHDVLFEYTDRYMAFTAPDGEYPGWWRSMSRYTANMWDKYRVECGPIWPETGPGAGPRLLSIGDRRVTAGETLTFTVSAAGSGLTYSATGLPAGATFAEKTFTWTPTAIGSCQVTFTVSDGSAQDSETITITVEKPNAAPILGSVGDRTTNENEALSFSLDATDADGDPITYAATGMPSGASFSGQTFTWTPGFNQAGAYSVTFTASDGRDQDSQTVAISVVNVNRPPTLAGIGDRSVDEDNTLTLALSAADPDGTGLTYSATGLPAGANLSGQSFTWTPTADQTGSYEITFVVSDGTLTDSETVTVMVVSTSMDLVAPVVARHSPAPGAIQVALNNLITLHVTDAGKGVNAASVRITVDGNVVYQGDTPVYTSAFGRCSRSGVKNDYQFVYQSEQLLDFDHEVAVTVNATDLAGNVMSESAYSFASEMRTFGSNTQVSESDTASKGRPATVGDAAGNIWVAWHAGEEGAGDIFVARLPAGRQAFETPVQITRDSADQRNPDLALATDGSLYVVWQDHRQGHWDIFGSVSTDGQTFARETAVVDANDNQTAPAVAVDSGAPNTIYVAWQDDSNGNQDIYVATSTNAFASVTAARVTTDAADQTEPDIAVGGTNTVYLVWTDRRNGHADIYGATAGTSWANVALITGGGEQTHPAVAMTPGGSDLHLLWMDNTAGDMDICYATSGSLPSGPLTGSSIIDDTSGADQSAPALVCAARGEVFACWQDTRNVGAYGTDADIYFAELGSGAAGTNILIGDGGARANQGEPAIAVSTSDQPYVVWTDDRDTVPEIYCAATTCIDPTPLHSAVVTTAAETTIGTSPTAITQPGDVSIVVPAGACQTDLRVTISRILNPLISPDDCLGSYDFGPSGIDFDQPVTVTIPYAVSGGGRKARAYWYNSLTGALSQQGITDIENIQVSGNLYALRFKTTHFTPYYIVAGDAEVALSGSGDADGGCSISPTGGGSPRDLFVPYAVVALAMAILRYRDRKRAARSTES